MQRGESENNGKAGAVPTCLSSDEALGPFHYRLPVLKG